MQLQAPEELILNRMPWSRTDETDPQLLLGREWLVTNGLGGYASGSVSGACTRRYHGWLVANLPAPLGRTVMLSHFKEEIELPDHSVVDFSGEELSEDHLDLRTARYLVEFRLETGLPIWRYEIDGHVIEKTLVMPHLQNTVHISYRLLSGDGAVRLRLRPSMHFRPHESPVNAALPHPYQVSASGDRYEIRGMDAPTLRFSLRGPDVGFVLDGGHFKSIFYRLEQSRGYEYRGPLWSPGYFRTTLQAGDRFTVIASTEIWDMLLALDPQSAEDREAERRRKLLDAANQDLRKGFPAELVLAADQFIVTPNTRIADAARAHASGDEVRTIFAGYHWFADWGRDTMISLEGLTLCTGRYIEAGYILRTFSHYIRDGLIPNLFPEREQEGLYHTADATLWYFHAIERYLRVTGDRVTLRLLLPKLLDIIDHHIRGTRFGIGMDPSDGLLRQGQEGYQLTWMDAKVGDWVVTPRRGKAVEINALWYNALRLLSDWCAQEVSADEASRLRELADRAGKSFNRRFWYEKEQYLYDVVDGETGDDPSLRPNQLFSFSLTHPVLEERRWAPVLDVVQRKLLTPFGLRSLSPDHPSYQKRYDGDLRARDAAYHQGTVWAWLIGPFVDAWLRVHPDERQTARHFLRGFASHMGDACIGSISEVFDAEEPFKPRGCVAQAWSVAEVIRCWIKTATMRRSD